MNIEFLLVFVYSYLLGSIPFGLIITKIFLKQDIRNVGSGNIGTTNVLRTGKKFLAITTLFFDSLKGYASVTISVLYFNDLVFLSALICFLGHLFPVWIKFKGGKGVATYLGILFALSYGLGVLFIFTWIVVTLIFKISSISSMFSTLTVLIVTVFREGIIQTVDPNFDFDTSIKTILFIFFILIIFTHRKNISNLKNKTEKKIKI